MHLAQRKQRTDAQRAGQAQNDAKGQRQLATHGHAPQQGQGDLHGQTLFTTGSSGHQGAR
jgi:hypothetical protein